MSKSASQASGLLDSAISFAKKITQSGVETLNHFSPAVTPLDQATDQRSSIEGQARNTYSFDKKNYAQPQHMIREHLPRISSQILGKHYSRMSKFGQMISPELNEKVANYFFEYLNEWVSKQSAVADLLEEVGAKNLAELRQDMQRSQRISLALSNQNKVIAAVLGAVTGATGVVGAAVDVPTSLMLALKSIYQTGRAYGFELNAEDYNVVEYIFKHVDMGSVAEKQALLAAIRAFSQVLVSHDLNQLQQLMGSSNDLAPLKAWLSNSKHVPTWLQSEPTDEWSALSVLAKFTPVFGMGVGALYSCHLVTDATNKAQEIFSEAREYLHRHPEHDLDPLSAYLAQQHNRIKSINTLQNVAQKEQGHPEALTDHAPDRIEPVEDLTIATESEPTKATSETQESSSELDVKNEAVNSEKSQEKPKLVAQETNKTIQAESEQPADKTKATTTKTTRKRAVKKPTDTPKN